MEISETTDGKEHEVQSSVGIGPPHEALFLAVAYFPLFELLATKEVCKSLRDAVSNDILPWLDIIVKKPLNSRITDDILIEITSKAKGRLRTLALISCGKITDDGLQQVVEKNPLLCKLYIPGCNGLTPEGILRAVKALTKHNHNLISLKICGIYGINKQHLETLCSLLRTNQKQQKQQAIFYHNHNNFQSFRNEETDRPIDIDICPKCDQPCMVFDCPREDCECRGCCYCVPRCAECGRCVAYEEQGDAACEDTLCLDCWIGLQKCDFCNRPYCNRHADRRCQFPGSSGFVCDACHLKFLQSSSD